MIPIVAVRRAAQASRRGRIVRYSERFCLFPAVGGDTAGRRRAPLGTVWLHADNGRLFTTPKDAWEYPAFLAVAASAQALLGAGPQAPATPPPDIPFSPARPRSPAGRAFFQSPKDTP